MAVYTPDLSTMTTGQAPAGFTKRFVANFSWLIADRSGTPYGKVIACASEAANDHNGLSLDAINSDPDRAYGETFLQFITPADPSNTAAYIMFRGGGLSGDTNLVRCGADAKDSEVSLGRYNSSNYFTYDGPFGFSFAANTTYNMLARVSDNALSGAWEVFVWEDGSAQPASPQLTYSGGISTDENWRGLFRNDAGPFDITFVSFSTGTDTADRPTASNTPTITDVDGDESVYDGQSYVIAATDDIGATQGTVFWERLDGTDSVQHTVTGWDASTDQITVTSVRGTHNYGTGLYRVKVVLADTTEIIFDNGGAGLSLEAPPNGYAVTAANPNTTDDASLWTGLVDTSTGNPITIVDGDQALMKDVNGLGNLSATPEGVISADTEGDFVVQIWLASEGVWGSDQTVTFTEADTTAPTVSSVSVPPAATYNEGQTLSFTVNWSEAVDVTGTPALNLDIGGSARQANYSSGTGTSAIVFAYTVQSGDMDSDGISVTSLTLDGGTIKDAAGNDANLTLNSVGDTSGVLVNAPDETPAAFTFTDKTDVALNAVIESDAITVSGVTDGANISVSVTGGEYAILRSGGSAFEDYTTANGTVQLGDQIKARHISSALNSTAKNTTLTVGGVSDTFTSTTLADGPGQFLLSPQRIKLSLA